MVIITFFMLLISFLWLSLEGRDKTTGYLFLFQVVVAGLLNGLTEKAPLIFFILFFSAIDIYMYFSLYKKGKKSCEDVEAYIEKNKLGSINDAVDHIIKLSNFGYLRFKTKKMIILSELIILLICIGELYG